MNRWSQKVSQYGSGLEKINELILLNLAVKEPNALVYNPETDGPIKENQLPQLDPEDPLTYITYAHFPPPLPLDKLVLLNELQQKISMGLESKEGALRALGEEFPELKLNEIRQELIEDAKSDGALNLVKAQIQKQLMDLTGMMIGPDGSATPLEPMMMGDGDVLGDGIEGPPNEQNASSPENQESIGTQMVAEQEIRNQLVTEAYGTRIPSRQTVDKD